MSGNLALDLPENWPTPGDELFRQSSWTWDANVATFPGERLYRMRKGFKCAADVLVASSEESPHERSNLVWPIVFCYRQCIELTLKDMIAGYGMELNPQIKPNWTDHALLPLWKAYKRLIDTRLIDTKVDEISEIKIIEAHLEVFDNIDSGSYTFRYPTDTKGKQTEIPLSSIDLLHLRTIMDGIYLYLDAAETALHEHFDSSHI